MTAHIRPGAFDSVRTALAELAARYPGARVLDVGGGSGTRAVPLAVAGCRVTVIDTSIDALAMLRRRAEDAGVADRVVGIQADADGLREVIPAGETDLVLCHHVLEELDDAGAAVAAMVAALAPGGAVSVLAAGRFSAVLGQTMAGRFGQAAAMLDDPDGRFGPSDPLRRRFDVGGLDALLSEHGLTVENICGVGVAGGLVSGAVRTAAQDEEGLGELECRLAGHPQLREIASDLHAIAVLPG